MRHLEHRRQPIVACTAGATRPASAHPASATKSASRTPASATGDSEVVPDSRQMGNKARVFPAAALQVATCCMRGPCSAAPLPRDRGRTNVLVREVTYGKVQVHAHELLVRLQQAVDELGDAEQLDLRALPVAHAPALIQRPRAHCDQAVAVCCCSLACPDHTQDVNTAGSCFARFVQMRKNAPF